MKKIKILYSGETTGAVSGFGKYGREVLSRLVQNDRFHIAELASGGTINDNRFAHAKWRYYPASVDPGHPEQSIYDSNHRNAFGVWRFDRTLLDFQPDFVMDIRDPWMMEHLFCSPLRDFYNLAAMPTVDSAPQQPQWIENFREADGVFTYSDWAIPVLKRQSGGDVKTVCSAYPGVDLNVFKPMNKIAIREAYGVPKDANIIGMVCRNQIRKLLPELFKAFKIFLDKYGHTDIGKKTYLYLHTSYPDMGWNIPAHLNEMGIGNRVFFTYYCRASGQPIVCKFDRAQKFSPYTNNLTGQFPNVGAGLSEDKLAEIINMFDLYVQYANCEGSGMPQIEAAACGIPIAAVDYSAMADIIEKTHGIALKPASIPRDMNLDANRAVPDNEYAADAFYKFFCLDKKYKERKGQRARQTAETYFNWDRTAKIWSDYFENTPLTGLQGKWDAPLRFNDFQIPEEIPQGLTHTQFVQWASVHVAKTPELAYKHYGLNWINMLNTGFTPGGHVDQKVAFEQFKAIGINKVVAEQARVNMGRIEMQDFIQFAHIFERSLSE